VAYYPFNGNANDASGHNLNGTANGGLTVVSNHLNQAASAYHLNGTNAYIYFGPILPDMTSMTFTLWVKVEASTGTTICEGDWTVGNDFNLTVIPSEEIFYCTKGGYNQTTWQNLNTNIGSQWAYVAWVVSTNQTQFFVNGALTVNLAQGGTDVGYHDFIVGTQEYPQGNFGWQNYWKGAVSDLRIYNRALSTNEVAQLYALQFPPILNVQKAVYLTSNNLQTGSNYQVQASSDLVNWTNQGSVFTATTNYWRSTNYWDVANWNQLFFRLQVAP
jgi:hypothetical protein